MKIDYIDSASVRAPTSSWGIHWGRVARRARAHIEPAGRRVPSVHTRQCAQVAHLNGAHEVGGRATARAQLVRPAGAMCPRPAARLL